MRGKPADEPDKGRPPGTAHAAEEGGENRLGRDLHHMGRRLLREQGAHGVGEAHRGGDLPRPVRGVQRGVVAAAVNRRVVGQRRLARRGAAGQLLEERGHRLHQGGVERVPHLEERAGNADVGEPAAGALQPGEVTGQHGGAGRVERADRHTGLRRRRLGGLVGVRAGRHHPAARGHALHQRATGGDQSGGRGQRQGARHGGRGELPDAVPRHGHRPHALLQQRRRQRVLHGEQGGLGQRRLVHLGPLLGQQLHHRAPQVRGQRLVGLPEMLPVGGAVPVQPRRHPRVLTALAGEDERRADARPPVRAAVPDGEAAGEAADRGVRPDLHGVVRQRTERGLRVPVQAQQRDGVQTALDQRHVLAHLTPGAFGDPFREPFDVPPLVRQTSPRSAHPQLLSDTFTMCVPRRTVRPRRPAPRRDAGAGA
ncbi:hypothetical protein SALBM217S_04199 [Streptomyces griseoloalbus]